MNSNKNIALIIPYYGEFPFWFPLFLKSCQYSQLINWHIFTDLKHENQLPKNVFIHQLKKSELSKLIFEKTGIKHSLPNPYKLCDFKPLYGVIFEDYLKGYNYWGHCDMDIIWGYIDVFLKRINYSNFDLISTRQRAISGHFNLYKNRADINNFFKSVPNFEKAFMSDTYSGFDEGFYSYHLFEEIKQNKVDFKIFWPSRHCIDRWELSLNPNGWYWEKGNLKNKNELQGNYLHLIDWKKTMSPEIDFDIESSEKFDITQYGFFKEIPFNIKLKSFFNSAGLRRIKLNLSKIKKYIIYDILKKPKSIEKANVIDGYKVLD